MPWSFENWVGIENYLYCTGHATKGLKFKSVTVLSLRNSMIDTIHPIQNIVNIQGNNFKTCLTKRENSPPLPISPAWLPHWLVSLFPFPNMSGFFYWYFWYLHNFVPVFGTPSVIYLLADDGPWNASNDNWG